MRIVEHARHAWLRFLRVPPEPAVPPGEAVVRTFRAAPRYFTWRKIVWAGSQVGTLAGAIAAHLVVGEELPVEGVLGTIFNSLVWVAWFGQFLVSLAVLRLDYELRWYILTDRSLRIREGVLRVTEKTMTYANIQHLSVRQGPLQRFLGIADIQVRPAGGGAGSAGRGKKGGGGEDPHLAYFRGVDRPDEILAAIRDRVRRYRDAGLGDPDDVAPELAPSAVGGAAIPAHEARALSEAARTLSSEARALREQLDAGR